MVVVNIRMLCVAFGPSTVAQVITPFVILEMDSVSRYEKISCLYSSLFQLVT